MVRMMPSDVDLLLTAEAMGIPLITAISERSGIPFSIVRKRKYGIEGEVSLRQVTGYSDNDLYMNLPKGRKKIVIVDDVLSTGGTIRAMVGGLRSTGGDVRSILVFADKMAPDTRKRFEDDMGCPIRTLVHVDVLGGRCIVRPEDRLELDSGKNISVL